MPEQFVQFEVQGQRVYGMLHLPDGTSDTGKKVPAVAMCHGFTGNRIEAHRLFVKAARHFVQHGIAVLRFDFRGSGESEGDFEQVTVSGEIADALAALQFLRQQPHVDAERLGLIGLSLGGCVAACAAAQDGRVKALVLWAAVGDLKELFISRWGEPIRQQIETQGYWDMGGWKISKAFYEDAQQVEPLREILRYDGATLIVHGTNDTSVPVDHAHRYHTAVRGTKRLHLIDGADHTFARSDWETELFAVTLDWLKTHL